MNNMERNYDIQGMPKFKRVKKQKQHSITNMHNNNDTNDNNNLLNTIATNNSTTITATGKHIVKSFKQNFTLNQTNCTLLKSMNHTNANIHNNINENIDNDNDNMRESNATMAVNGDQATNESNVVDAKMLQSPKPFDGNAIVSEPRTSMTSKKVKRQEKVSATTLATTKPQRSSAPLPKKPPKHNHNVGKSTKKSRKTNTLNSYLMRLESIKYQILMKLGLKQKPNITSLLPKHVIMETLYRADDINAPPSRGTSFLFALTRHYA